MIIFQDLIFWLYQNGIKTIVETHDCVIVEFLFRFSGSELLLHLMLHLLHLFHLLHLCSICSIYAPFMLHLLHLLHEFSVYAPLDNRLAACERIKKPIEVTKRPEQNFTECPKNACKNTSKISSRAKTSTVRVQIYFA